MLLFGALAQICSFRLGKLLHSRKVTLVKLGPYGLYPRPSLQCGFLILPALLRSFAGQTFVDVSLDVVAASDGFEKEPAGVAFVERVHNSFAVCNQLDSEPTETNSSWRKEEV